MCLCCCNNWLLTAWELLLHQDSKSESFVSCFNAISDHRSVKMASTNLAILVYLLYFTIKHCTCDPHLYQITHPVDHAEGPTWDSRTGLLYFVDIHAGNVFSYDYASRQTHFVHLDGEVTPVIPSRHNPDYLIVGLNRTVVLLVWDAKSDFCQIKPLTTVSKQFPTSRFNDGKADKQGRLWFGTMGFEDSNGVAPNQGVLYKITRGNLRKPEVMVAPVNISNGLAWNKANDRFYYIDTPTRQIVEYVYDDAPGQIRNPRVVFDLNLYDIKGFPDGMTIDEDDNLWVALYNGGAVIKIDPVAGHLLQIFAIPADAVTSVMWGGSELDILYITTSRFRLTPQQRALQPLAGSVFALVGLGTKGREVYDADIVDKL